MLESAKKMKRIEVCFEEVKGFLIGKRFKTALDVLDIIKLFCGSYKWHNNPDGTLTVKVNKGAFNIRFDYSTLDINERVIVSTIKESDEDDDGENKKEGE